MTPPCYIPAMHMICNLAVIPYVRYLMCFFFFSSRRRHTRCLSDWSSDVCSSDLLEALSENDEVKFVLSTRRDYEFARDFTSQHGLARRVRQVLFSPVFEDPQGKRSEEGRVGEEGRSRGSAYH